MSWYHTDFAAHHLRPVCIGQVQEDMTTAMKDGMEAVMEIEMLILMGGKKNTVLEMIVRAKTRILMVVIMKNAITEMVTGTMIIEEEAKALMTISMVQGAGALTGMKNVHTMMMVKVLLGRHLLQYNILMLDNYYIFILVNFSIVFCQSAPSLQTLLCFLVWHAGFLEIWN